MLLLAFRSPKSVKGEEKRIIAPSNMGMICHFSHVNASTGTRYRCKKWGHIASESAHSGRAPEEVIAETMKERM